MERDPVKVVRLAGGQARTSDVVAFTGRQRLRVALCEGRLIRVRRGLYALPGLPDAVKLAAELGGVVSHASAAELTGLQLVRRPDRVHVTLTRGSRPASHPAALVHWTRHLAPEEVHERITEPLRTVLDCAATMPFAEALAIADSAAAQRFIDADSLLRAAQQRPGPQRARCLRVARLTDHRAENPLESALRAIVIDTGLGGFEPQVRIDLRRRVHFADLADVRRRLVLEAEGYARHGSRDALARDCDRDNALVADGWTVLRFSWEHVMLRPAVVAAVLIETCRRLDRRRS